jgi:activator of HSP90 ATPase
MYTLPLKPEIHTALAVNLSAVRKKEGHSMISNHFTRREFSARLAAWFSALGVAGTALASTAGSGASDDISHTAEAIHQEIVFNASRKRIYEALTDTKQFDKVTQLSAAMKSGTPPGATPTAISREAGGTFSLFGGYIVGRHIELVPNERIVQAWRVGDWKPGVYSIARFELTEQATATKLVFEHTGFPEGAAQHLADGWKMNYWEPLKKFLA